MQFVTSTSASIDQMLDPIVLVSIQCFAVKLSEGKHQGTSSGGQICIYKLKPQICIVMHACVWSLHTCVQLHVNRVYSVVKIANYYFPQDMP